jgi:hypothetical protein
MNPVHTVPTYFSKTNPSIIPSPMTKSSRVVTSFRFPHQNHVCISLFPHACYMPNLICLDWIILMISSWENTSRSSTLCNFLILLLLPPSYVQIYSSTPYYRTHSVIMLFYISIKYTVMQQHHQ